MEKTIVKEFINFKEELTFEFVNNVHCVSCGNKGVWSDCEDDFYVGLDYFCLECETIFNAPNIKNSKEMCDYDLDIMKKLKSIK